MLLIAAGKEEKLSRACVFRHHRYNELTMPLFEEVREDPRPPGSLSTSTNLVEAPENFKTGRNRSILDPRLCTQGTVASSNLRRGNTAL
jgi:hypothetical protein